ncbi:hypothetical protein HZC09_05890 [Candidatus Micrarchaeota archaeon]|nr:hypothetical protein [Candidatus Micrarchaeota archaeon]
MQEVVPKIYSAVTQLWGFERKDKELKVKIVAGGPFSAALWEEDRKTLTVPALSKYDLNAQLGLPAEVSERDVLVAVLSHEMTHYVVNGWLLEKNVKQTSVPLWAREGMAALGEDKVTGLLGRQKVDKFMYAKRQDSDFSSRAFELKDKPGTLGLAFWNAYPADREANFYYGGAYSFYNYLYVKVFGGSYQSLLSLTEKLAWKDANSAFTGETGKSFSTVKEEWYASLRIPAVTPLPTPTPSPTPAPEKDCGWGLLGC